MTAAKQREGKEREGGLRGGIKGILSHRGYDIQELAESEEFGTDVDEDWEADLGGNRERLSRCFVLVALWRIAVCYSKGRGGEWCCVFGVLIEGKQRAHEEKIKMHTMVHEKLIEFYRGFKTNAHPMAILVGVVGALSAFYHDSLDITNPTHVELSMYRLIAKMPTIAAIAYKTSIGRFDRLVLGVGI